MKSFKFLKRGIDLINEHSIDEDGSKLKYRGLKAVMKIIIRRFQAR